MHIMPRHRDIDGPDLRQNIITMDSCPRDAIPRRILIPRRNAMPYKRLPLGTTYDYRRKVRHAMHAALLIY